MDKLAKINASARYELLNANQQLLDFHLNVGAAMLSLEHDEVKE